MSKREQNKEERRQKMIEAAAAVYSEKGIDDTTIQEVADHAGVGVASVYRYFPGKTDLAVAAALYMWQCHMIPLSRDLNIDQGTVNFLRAYMNGFLQLFSEKPQFLRFIENFDNYISRQSERPEAFNEYETMLTEQDQSVTDRLRQGQTEGTVRGDIHIPSYYAVSTKAIMAMAQKLLLRGSIVKSDRTEPVTELKILIEMLLESIITES